jgi:colanic acid biosynthesis glycosyl transferase WcaI
MALAEKGPMRILYLTQWFDPEPGLIKGPRFVRALEAAGHDVTVVTGFPNYPTGKLYPGYRLRPFQRETIDGAHVVRLPLYPSHDGSSFRRALNFLSFFLSVLLYCLFRRARYDVAYVYHPPITVSLAAALAGRIRRLPFLLEIQDLWPDTVAATGMGGASVLARLLDPVCNFVYRHAAAIIAQSAGICDALLSRGVTAAKITIVRNWADIEHLPAVPTASDRAAPITIVYGGNFGRGQALTTVVDAALLVEQRSRDIRILLYGDGIDAEMLRAHALRAGTTILEFHERISRTEIIAVFARADGLLLHLADDPLFEITIPSKTQFYLAMGRPIIGGVSGEAARLLRESGAAFIVPPMDAAALAQAMCDLADLPPARREAMGKAGQRYYRRYLSFEEGMARTLALLEGTNAGALQKNGVGPQ